MDSIGSFVARVEDLNLFVVALVDGEVGLFSVSRVISHIEAEHDVQDG